MTAHSNPRKKTLDRLEFLIVILAIGASLIIGLLSFGGFYALWPSIGLASLSFGLSVAYEGEIYFQNIKGALNKLLNPDYAAEQLANEVLLEHFPEEPATNDCPEFFKNYAKILSQLHAFEHAEKNKINREAKRKTKLQLAELEADFYAALNNISTTRNNKLLDDLKKYRITQPNGTQTSLIELYQKKLPQFKAQHQTFNRVSQLFSALAVIFMTLGTSYLLVEAFTLIPFLAAIPVLMLPGLILPMAVISGIAYGLLTYNSLMSIMTNSSIVENFNQLKQDFMTNGFSVRNTLFALTAVLLFSLAVGLTLCTAGTWWTIVQETRPLFGWMSKIPTALIAIFTAVVNSLSALAFNLENSSESLSMLDTMSRTNPFQQAWDKLHQKLNDALEHDNLFQLLNPFRIVYFLTFTPLRICLFLGHLISIGVTGDRVPGVSKIGSALLGIISEFFEDLHYFVETPHEENLKALLKDHLNPAGHSHEDDLPTQVLKLITRPIRELANGWHELGNLFNPKPTELPPAKMPAGIPQEPIHNKRTERKCKIANCGGDHSFFAQDFAQTCEVIPRKQRRTRVVANDPLPEPDQQIAGQFF